MQMCFSDLHNIMVFRQTLVGRNRYGNPCIIEIGQPWATATSGQSREPGTTSPLWKQLVPSQVARLVDFLIEVAILGLDGIGGQQHGSLRRAVNIIIENALLHLKEEQALCDVLDQFLGYILRVELGPELEKQRAFLPHILGSHLGAARSYELSKNRL